MTPKVGSGVKEIGKTEPGTPEIYDREAILYELADPANLGTIEKLERMHGGSASEEFIKSTETFEAENADGTPEERREFSVKRIRKTLKGVPDTVLHILTGKIYPGDCGRPSDQKPDWLDMDKLRRGQKFARDHLFCLLFAEMLTLGALYNFEDFLKPIIMTKKSSSPYAALKRYLSTTLRIRNWYTEDPWAKGSRAWKDISTTRAMHAAVQRKFDSLTSEELDVATTIPNPWCPMQDILHEDFSQTCQAPVIGQCPYTTERNSPDRPKSINQAEMALTQWNQIAFITSFPEKVGAHDATDEDLEALCHLWRSIGYQMGIEERYNYCRGTLEEIRQRNRDFLEAWVKPNLREITPELEHVLRCIFTGTSVVMPGVTFETALLHLTDVLEMPMPRLYASLSYKDWISYTVIKSVVQYGVKIPGLTALCNIVLNRALDGAAKFTPDELKAIRIKFSTYRENGIQKHVAI